MIGADPFECVRRHGSNSSPRSRSLVATDDMTMLHDAPESAIMSTGSSTVSTVNTPECGFILNTQSDIDAFLCHIGRFAHFCPLLNLCERYVVNVGVTSQSRAPTNQL